MSEAIGIKTAVLADWATEIPALSPALTSTKMPDWRGIARLPPSADSNINSPRVTQKEAQGALDRLLTSLPQSAANEQGKSRLSLDRLGSTDMQLIMSMAGNLSLGVFSDLCKSMGKQMERASDVQIFLRDKRVAEYQQQIDKAVEQADKARKAGIFNAVLDWIIGAVEVVYGALKVAEGVLTGNPVAIASGVAYLAAGTAGLLKAAAETAMLLGASKEKFQGIIDVASKVQLSFECFAMAIDLYQVARAINAGRAMGKGAKECVTGALKEVCSSPLMIIQKCSSAAVQINNGQLAVQSAGLRKEIEQLIMDQEFTQYMDEWVERNKQHQLKQLKANSQDAQELLGKLKDNIQQSGMLQVAIAGSLV
ncbi:secreted effector protein sseC [Yersinia rohdei]|uniref:Secreted effector protein sseC n=1 Tax=Yersinia rohdei TaxID=29485 RepID=A0ABM5SCU9_YERRO|nr:type III secretion system translocon subunit SctE [Yersinia rohdei]AJJ11156.1 secreted effector protein sseC [Yersinia rohdei]